MTRPRFNRLTWFILVTTWGLTAVLSYWALQRSEPVELAGPPELMTPAVLPGQRVEVRYCVYRTAIMATHRIERLFDGSGAEVAEEMTQWRYAVGGVTKPGEPDCYVQGIKVPEGSSAGVGRYRVVVSWRQQYNLVHLFWPVVRVFPDVRFEILRAGK